MHNKNKKIIVLTGANGLLGKTFVKFLLAEKNTLICIDKTFKSVQKEIQKNYFSKENIFFEKADLEKISERKRISTKIQNKFKSIDCIIHNAAHVGKNNLKGWNSKFENQSIFSWRQALEVNLIAPFHLNQLLIKKLKNGRNPLIINIGSIYGKWGPDWNLYKGTNLGNPAAYGASKAGIIYLTKWLACTLGPKIRVNCICPGGIENNQPKIFINRYRKKTILKKMAQKTDILGFLKFLLSDDSLYLTGQIFFVDGGWGLN